MNADHENSSWLSLGIEIVRVFPWFVGTILLVLSARKICKWRKFETLRDAVNPTPKHEEDVKEDVRELLAETLDADSANSIADGIDKGEVGSSTIAAKHPDLVQIDVVYEKTRDCKIRRTVEVAVGCQSGTMRVTTATRMYDYDFAPADVREEMIRKNTSKVAKLRYRAEGK